MSNPDRESPQGKPELKLIMPSLPTLYEGVFEDVYADYISNPDTFRVTFEHNLIEDNPALVPFFATDLLFDDDEVSIKWPAIYYEMFARSSRRDGLPPLQIPQNTVDVSLRMESLELDNAFENVNFGLLEKLRSEWEERKELWGEARLSGSIHGNPII